MYIVTGYRVVSHGGVAIDFGEGPIAYESWLASQGHNFYVSYIHTSKLVLVVPYPPLFQWFSSMLIKFGFSPITAGRGLSFTSTLVSSMLVYLLLRKLKVDKLISGVIALSLFSLPPIFMWSLLNRVDMLGLMFTLISLLLFFEEKHFLSFITISLAILTKQSFISLPFVIFVYLLISKKYARVIELVFLVVFPQIVLSLSLPNYFDNVILANMYQHLNFDIFYRGVQIVLYYWILIALSVYATLLILQKQGINKEYTLLTGYFIVSIVWALVSYSKPGSSINYFIEPLVLSLVMIGLLFSFSSSSQTRLLLSILLFGMLVNFALTDNSISEFYSTQISINYAPLYHKLETINGTIFSEDPYLAFKTHKGPVVDIFLLTRLYYAGVWNQSVFLNDIASQKFSEIITLERLNNNTALNPNSRYTKQMVQCILLYYQLNGSIGKYYIYLPKPNAPREGICHGLQGQ
ncbi:ArnT family glycosyltransferase [Thermococcus henrietii]|uniref:ArnT family glycosyltransferase n=1 Tax=Thermococcus henrietii TaxID=2016361 RepID=UPI001313EDA3|nr:glycosyltransferase family 39 protein [Thermococcus henrietii]